MHAHPHPAALAPSSRFIYTAFLTVICLMCPAIVIWLDPWKWEWPNYAFLISGNASALVFFWLAGPFFWPYFLFQTGVGYFRVFAMWSGLVGSQKSKGWKVGALRARGPTGKPAPARGCIVHMFKKTLGATGPQSHAR